MVFRADQPAYFTAGLDSVAEGGVPSAPVSAPAERISIRAVVAGFVLAVLLCGVNSYLTLSFGVIEEGPTIAALFFFATFFMSRKKITSTEMVIVATMGSAGGSLGFISNFYAAQVMTGTPYTLWEMTGFAVVTSLVGLMFVVPLRELLVMRENLPWPGSKAVESVIRALVDRGDPKQPIYLLVSSLLCIIWVVGNKDGGFGVFPYASDLPLFGLAAFGASIAWSPFAIGGAYLMGFRTCVGFLFGAIVLLIMAPHTPVPAAPHRYVWPGIGFLVATGLTSMAIHWRVIVDSMRSLLRPAAKTTVAAEAPVVSAKVLAALCVVALGTATAFGTLVMGLNVLLILILIVVGGFIQNVIATRAAAQTAFNPARVMGVLLQGVTAAAGGSSTAQNLAGAGFVAGSGAQAGNLTGDMAYGRWLGVPARWQFWTQTLTILPCAFVSAWVFSKIAHRLSLEGEGLPAPVAKMWAATALIFDGSTPMPPGAMQSMLIAGAIGVVYVLLESRPKLERFMPSSIGLGLGLVLPIAYDLGFFLGGVLLFGVLGRGLKVRALTLTTIAVGAIVGEGLGGIMKPVLQMLKIVPG